MASAGDRHGGRQHLALWRSLIRLVLSIPLQGNRFLIEAGRRNCDCWITDEIAWLPEATGKSLWPGLRSIAMLRYERRIGKQVTVSARFYLTALAPATAPKTLPSSASLPAISSNRTLPPSSVSRIADSKLVGMTTTSLASSGVVAAYTKTVQLQVVAAELRGRSMQWNSGQESLG